MMSISIIYYIQALMGPKNSKNRDIEYNAQMSVMHTDPDELFDEFIHYKDCCGMRFKKSQKFVLIWQQTLVKNCQELKTDYPVWTQAIIDVVRSKKISRSKYLQEVNELRDQQNQPILRETTILLSPSEIDQFKQNLKKSVLISYGQALKANRPKDMAKIQSLIMTPTKKVRGKSKNDQLLTEFRKSTVSREKHQLMREASSVKKNKLGFRESMITFVDDTLSSLFRGQEKEISKQSAHSLQIFVRFTIILQRHLKDPENKLNLVVQAFNEGLYKHYNKDLMTLEQTQTFCNNIKIFLVLLRDAVEDYYNTPSFGDMNENNNFLISNSENILTVVTTIMFKDQKFYNFVFSQVNKYNSQKDQKLQMILKHLSNKQPEVFEVRPEYCLNQVTIKQCERLNNNLKESTEQQQNIQTEKFDTPYYLCSDNLSLLKKTKTPISKMKVILESAEKITDCVSAFYKQHELENKNCIFDADQILAIFCYVLTKTQLKNIHSHLFILQHFATENQLISMMGYYYSVLSCAIEQLETVYAKDIESEIEKSVEKDK